jgi:hypothetical protein
VIEIEKIERGSDSINDPSGWILQFRFLVDLPFVELMYMPYWIYFSNSIVYSLY